jgi:ATP phosphoribosyltransferase regulatory subunit
MIEAGETSTAARPGVRPVTPRGFRDVMPQEAAEREAVRTAVLGAMAAWGYRRVETPAVERAETLSAGEVGALEGETFRLVDVDGGLLALRPEMTVPVARLVASRMTDADQPKRLCYAAEVFREHASYRGQSRQFSQLGLEYVGAEGPVADAEVVAVMAEAIAAAGLADFMIGVGTVGVLSALLEESGADGEWREAVIASLHQRNLVALDGLAREIPAAPGVRAALADVPRLRGGREAIQECRRLLDAAGRADALDDLERTWELLEAAGVAGRVTVDFGILRSFDYYTGLVVEAYAPGLGVPLGGGGRYDELLGGFGTPAPAAGFALGLERLHLAAAEAGVVIETPGIDAVVAGPEAAAVFETAARERADGRTVLIVTGPDREAASTRARAAGAEDFVWVEG